jgi:hypothetical protein
MGVVRTRVFCSSLLLKVEGAGYTACSRHSNGANGKGPLNVILDVNGNIIGTTNTGGKGSERTKQGTVFKYDGTLQDIYAFCSELNCADGRYPVGGVIQDASGDLFGTTEQGGSDHNGMIYELSP